MKCLIKLFFSLHSLYRFLPRSSSALFCSWVLSLLFLISHSHLHAEKITAPDGAASDNFGQSISLSGNILAVGAAYIANPGALTDAGAAYLYQLEANGSATY